MVARKASLASHPNLVGHVLLNHVCLCDESRQRKHGVDRHLLSLGGMVRGRYFSFDPLDLLGLRFVCLFVFVEGETTKGCSGCSGCSFFLAFFRSTHPNPHPCPTVVRLSKGKECLKRGKRTNPPSDIGASVSWIGLFNYILWFVRRVFFSSPGL